MLQALPPSSPELPPSAAPVPSHGDATCDDGGGVADGNAAGGNGTDLADAAVIS